MTCGGLCKRKSWVSYPYKEVSQDNPDMLDAQRRAFRHSESVSCHHFFKHENVVHVSNVVLEMLLSIECLRKVLSEDEPRGVETEVVVAFR